MTHDSAPGSKTDVLSAWCALCVPDGTEVDRIRSLGTAPSSGVSKLDTSTFFELVVGEVAFVRQHAASTLHQAFFTLQQGTSGTTGSHSLATRDACSRHLPGQG